MAYQKSKFVYFCNRVYFSVYCLSEIGDKYLSFPLPRSIREKAHAGVHNRQANYDCYFLGRTIGFSLLVFAEFFTMLFTMFVVFLTNMSFTDMSLIPFMDLDPRIVFWVFMTSVIGYPVLFGIFIYIVFERKNLHMKYFRLFERESKEQKTIWNLCTLASFIILWIFNFILMFAAA